MRALVTYLARREGVSVNRDALQLSLLPLLDAPRATVVAETANDAVAVSIAITQEASVDPEGAIDDWIDKRDIAIVDLIGQTGATVNEVCVLALGQGDDIKNGCLDLPGAGHVRPRTVIIPDPVASKVRGYLLMRPQSVMASDPLFIGVNGGKLFPRIVQLTLERAVPTSGLAASMPPRDLRAGAILDMKSARIGDIEIMGHFGVTSVKAITSAIGTHARNPSDGIRVSKRHENDETALIPDDNEAGRRTGY